MKKVKRVIVPEVHFLLPKMCSILAFQIVDATSR
jgi:hypothetical protein